MYILRLKNPLPRFIIILVLVSMGLVAVSWWRADLYSSPAKTLPDVSFTESIQRTGAATDRLIDDLQTKLRTAPDDWQSYSQLGLVYLQKARETGDPSFYKKSEGVLEKSLSLQPDDYVSVSAMGALASARHQFRDALEWGERARAINPDRPYAYGVIADAQVELGLYEEAVQTMQVMVDLHPDMSSYARVSYLRELHGDTEGATEMMQWAVDSGVPDRESTAWTRTQLGNLYFNSGNLKKAEQEYLRTLQDFPEYVYALAGLGRVRLAQGHTAEGIDLFSRASQRIPMPEFIIALADIYKMNGQPASAQKQYALLQAIHKLYLANGVDMDLEMALFNADHDIDLVATLAQARRAFERRPSTYAADVLAWLLYKNGSYKEALAFSDQALRLGTRDALKLYHAGMIRYRLGDYAQARQYLERALTINPYFSLLYAQEAQHTLGELKAVHLEK